MMQMAEPDKGVSSSTNSKETTLLLDLDIGKDFLTSWKSMSVTDDAMDFDFGTVTKGKKKTFNFDNSDMDFTLDTDFDKISSFKVDVSDLDISIPAKIAGKQNEGSKEASTSGNQGKQERFAFAFDFNEFDSLSFEPRLAKEDKISNKNQDREGSSDRRMSQGSGIQLAGDVGEFEVGITPKVSRILTSGSVDTSKANAQGSDAGNLHSLNKDGPLKPARIGNCPSMAATVKDQVAAEGAITSPEKIISTCPQETEQDARQSEKIASEPSSEESAKDLSIQSIDGDASVHDTASELLEEVTASATKVSATTCEEHNVNVKPNANSSGKSENPVSENLSPQEMASLESGCKDVTEPVQADSQLEDTSVASVSRELLHNTEDNGENSISKPVLNAVNSGTGTMAEKLMLEKERDIAVIQSKYFMRPDNTESQLQQATLSRTKMSSFGTKRIDALQTSAADESRECNDKDIQSGSRSVSFSRPDPRGVPIQRGSPESFKGLNSIGEGFNTDSAQSGSKLISISRRNDQDVTERGPAFMGSEKNIKDANTFRSSEHTNKSTSQNCMNPRLTVSSKTSLRSLKNVSVERNVASSLDAGRITPDLASVKILRTSKPNNDLLASKFQKDIKSLRNTEQGKELQGKPQSKVEDFANKKMQIALTPTLKRKTLEESYADMLNVSPSKRLAVSPSESRNVREPSERIADEQVCNHESLADGNALTASNERQIYAIDIPREISMADAETPLGMEDDSNVEKAEACSKELEDICSMLKKKHEEAKELLVRAIVNNNNLLMLNHPIYQEKIRLVQKFADSLMSKELTTCM